MSNALEELFARAEAEIARGELGLATELFAAGMKRWPDEPALLYNFGNLQVRRGDFSGAVTSFGRVTQLAPGFSWAHHNLGDALRRSVRLGEAAAAFRQALVLDPGLIQSRVALARLLVNERRSSEAAQLLQEGLWRQPNSADLEIEFGLAQQAMGNLPAAIQAYQRALQLAPNSAPANHNLAAAFLASGQVDQALAFARRALELRPGFAATHEILAAVLAHQGELPAARAAFAAQAALQPPGSRWNTAGALRAALLLPPVIPAPAAIDDARADFAVGIERMRKDPGSLVDPIAEIGVVNQFYLAFHGRNNRELLCALAAMYRELCPALTFTARHCREPAVARSGRIRIGIVSAYLREHTVGRYLIGLVQHLSRELFEVCLFTWRAAADARAQAFVDAADEFHLLSGPLSAQQSEIAAAHLDVLLFGDIGMEPASYFLSFARLAPIQCAFFGHPETTGVDTIDHFLSWAPTESADAQEWYSEKLALLSPSVTYAHLPRLDWQRDARDRLACGLPGQGRVYLCVQPVYKMHPDFDELIAQILGRDADAHVVLVASTIKQWNLVLNQRLSVRLGRDMARVSFVAERPFGDYLALLASADVVLDTPHFNGGASTLDAIVTGTPVVTLSGRCLRGAQTRGLFERMGVTDGICWNADDYASTAVRIARDRDLRDDISRRIGAHAHVLFEDLGAVREFETLLCSWCAAPQLPTVA